MAYRDILVYANDDKGAAARFDAAALLGGGLRAHIAALHVKALTHLPVDAGMGIPPQVFELLEEMRAERAAKARQVVDAAAQRLGRPIEYREAEDLSVEGALAIQARYADVTVMSKVGSATGWSENDGALPEAVALESGRPVLVVPGGAAPAALGQHVLIAWKSTREAVRAVHDAMPVLAAAKAVTILEVNPEFGARRIVAADIATHLARHGIKAEAASTTAADIEISSVILARAWDVGADMIVMGAYGHSKLRETVFGGVTREMLRNTNLPVLLSH